ncbi:hypothetical protein QBC35DRAFT_490340 [Podospora australis]|uniref:Uncharacterized protein n=1 Tax=Podospora australis TaxID=1536484 RepID=A0AAN7AKE0_9PEZI|nr:hypothetical protein QBC35DRAFT_490340 [Podospora australis]
MGPRQSRRKGEKLLLPLFLCIRTVFFQVMANKFAIDKFFYFFLENCYVTKYPPSEHTIVYPSIGPFFFPPKPWDPPPLRKE